LILALLYKHTERLRPLDPDTVEMRGLQLLVETRREAVDDKTRYVNRLTSQLKVFFPQVLESRFIASFFPPTASHKSLSWNICNNPPCGNRSPSPQDPAG
jgi:hypothetical protein